MRNRDVIQAWMSGGYGRNSRGTLRTDGRVLWSYRLPIGITATGGHKVVFLYRAPSHFRSMTTSKHVSLALGKAHVGCEPFLGFQPYRNYTHTAAMRGERISRTGVMYKDVT